MAPPRKPDGDKLVPVTTNLHPDTYAAICRVARQQRMKPATYLRALILNRLKTSQAIEPVPSC
jgi:hypothetical protein